MCKRTCLGSKTDEKPQSTLEITSLNPFCSPNRVLSYNSIKPLADTMYVQVQGQRTM